MRNLLLAALFAWSAAPSLFAAEIKTATLDTLAPPIKHELSAAVISANDSQIAAEVNATVKSIGADVGASVKQGTVLIELDARDAELMVQQARAQLDAAEAQLVLAQQRLKRGEELDQRNFISADELLALNTQVRAAQAERDIRRAGLANAERQRQKCIIKAPFDGVVQARMAQVGAMAMAGMPLVRLVATAEPEVEAALPSGVLSAEAVSAQQATFAFLYRGAWLPLQLRRLSQVIDPASRTQVARFGFIDEAAPAGSQGTLKIIAQGFSLPPELVVERDGRRGAFVVEAGHARFRPIEGALPGRSADVSWPADTVVVSQGHLTLQDGEAVELSASQ